MNKKRADQLRAICHDREYGIKVAMDCGKKLPSLDEIRTMYLIMEEILTHVSQDLGSR